MVIQETVSGRGKAEFDIPDILAGQVLCAEVWGRWRLSHGFHVHGELKTADSEKSVPIGSLATGKDRAHMLIPADYRRLSIRGWSGHGAGFWNFSFSDPSKLPEIPAQSEGRTSRIFSHHGGELSVDLEFTAGGGVVLFGFDGKGEGQRLMDHTDRFRGKVTIPRAGLVAVMGAYTDLWGSMPPWRMVRGAG
ncbi:hypothetical protein [Streptomyces sp. NBC_01304]|uniref:hypothetical protein n=1 Tax=Streptomyces sp. NBC_01304 TaxID=2903818 RepID=UPI002E1493BD|nr:hypothetical protein OG430_23910 [Streptomyces sp. NBC_01304]